MCSILKMTKDSIPLDGLDESEKEQLSDFYIIMSIIKRRDSEMSRVRNNFLTFLSILFPKYEVSLGETTIDLTRDGEVFSIDKDNYQYVKNIILVMVGQEKDANTDYNPQSDYAKKLAEKMRRGRAKASKAKGVSADAPQSLFEHYVSILVTGQQLSYDQVCSYTIYQVIDAFKRYELKMNYDIYVSSKLAGASKMKEVDNWMKNIHE